MPSGTARSLHGCTLIAGGATNRVLPTYEATVEGRTSSLVPLWQPHGVNVCRACAKTARTPNTAVDARPGAVAFEDAGSLEHKCFSQEAMCMNQLW